MYEIPLKRRGIYVYDTITVWEFVQRVMYNRICRAWIEYRGARNAGGAGGAGGAGAQGWRLGLVPPIFIILRCNWFDKMVVNDFDNQKK